MNAGGAEISAAELVAAAAAAAASDLSPGGTAAQAAPGAAGPPNGANIHDEPQLRLGGAWPYTAQSDVGGHIAPPGALPPRATRPRRRPATASSGADDASDGAPRSAPDFPRGGVVAVALARGVRRSAAAACIHVAAYFGVPYVILDGDVGRTSPRDATGAGATASEIAVDDDMVGDSAFGTEAVSVIRPRVPLRDIVADFVRRGGTAVPIVTDVAAVVSESERRKDASVRAQHVWAQMQKVAHDAHLGGAVAPCGAAGGTRGAAASPEPLTPPRTSLSAAGRDDSYTFAPPTPSALGAMQRAALGSQLGDGPIMIIVGPEHGGVPVPVLAACSHTAVVDHAPATASVEAVLRRWPAQYFRTVMTAAAMTHGATHLVASSVCPAHPPDHLLAALLTQLESPVRRLSHCIARSAISRTVVFVVSICHAFVMS